jgi:hypothetical protein
MIKYYENPNKILPNVLPRYLQTSELRRALAHCHFSRHFSSIFSRHFPGHFLCNLGGRREERGEKSKEKKPRERKEERRRTFAVAEGEPKGVWEPPGERGCGADTKWRAGQPR